MTVDFYRRLELREETDVFVAGGGPAGIAASLAASRLGKKVFMAETGGVFGGAGTAGLVPTFCPFDDGVNVVADGIGYEIRKMISADTPLFTFGTPIRVEELKLAYDKLMSESDVDFRFFSPVVDAVRTGQHIDYVVVSSKSGLYAVKAKIYIDCTGDGNLCAFAGADYEIGDENGDVQPGTLCSIWADVDLKKRTFTDDTRLEDAFRYGVFSYEDRHLPGIFGPDDDSGYGGGNLGHTRDLHPLDEKSITEEMLLLRRTMPEFEKYYKEYLHGFEKMKLIPTADVLGIRESRRIVCDYMLNVNDFLGRSVFYDEIGRYCYPIDLHVKANDKDKYDKFLNDFTHKYRYAKGESYGIPYRSLCPKGFRNLLVAGRCIGTDRPMQASIRAMPGCFITGQAAGAAAVEACKCEDIRSVDICNVQRNLLKIGAYLPNAGQ